MFINKMYSIFLLILHSTQADWVLVTKDLYEIDPVSLEPQLDNWMTAAQSDLKACTVPYAQAMYINNAGADWTYTLTTLSSYQGYYKMQIMMDIYVFALTTVKIYFNSAPLPIFTKTISELASSYCTATDALIRVNLELPITVYPTIPSIVVNGLTTQGSIKNFFVYVLKCPLNCLNCDSDGCQSCQSPFTPEGAKCVCRSPYAYTSSSGECLTQCPSGQFPYIDNKCQPISLITPLFSEMTSSSFAISGGTFITDPYFTQSVPSTVSIGSLSSAGPFRYNEGIQFTLPTPVSAGSIISLQYTIFWLSQDSEIQYQIGSKIYVYFDEKIVAQITEYIDKFIGPTISTMNCVSTAYSSCVMVKSQTIQAVDSFSQIKFVGALNLTSTSCSWAIRDIYLDQVTYNIPSVPTISSCIAGQKYFENACYTTCPSYTTDMGSTCQDIDSIYQYPLYLIKAFYDYNIYQKPESILGTDRYTYGPSKPASTYDLFYYQPINKLIFGGVQEFQGDQFIITLSRLPPHHKVKLFIKVLLIDGIQGQDQFVVKIDDNPAGYINFAVADQINTAVNLEIGTSGNDYKNENFNVEFSHTAETMKITIRCQLSSTSVGSCGIYDFFVILARCPKNCNSCTSDTICTSPLSYQISNCEYGTYYDLLTLSCLACPSGCMTCTSSACILCFPTFEMFGNTCYCKNGGFPSQYEACEKCHTNCQTCISKYSYGCLKCDTSINKWRDQTQCSCIPGYYMAETSYNCLPCDQKCKTCKSSSTQCTSCYDAQNRYFTYRGCDCLNGYFEVSYSADCLTCGSRCQTCYLSQNNCRSCHAAQNRRLISNQCYCDIGYFDDGTDICKPCMSTCQTCLTQNYCLTCYNEQYRVLSQLGGSCVCMSGHYEITNYDVCPPCHPTCSKCNNSDDISQCTKCPTHREPTNSLSETFQCQCSKGYYESSNYVCADCKVFQDPPPDHYCYSDCGDGIIQWNEDCDDMNDNPRDGCNECKFANSECLVPICSDCRVDSCVQCIDGFYLANDQHCYPCSEICVTCDSKSTNCTQCTITAEDGSCVNCVPELGFQIDGDKCVNICGDGIKVDGEQCDDGNTKDGDGCDSKCYIESGSMCSDSCEPVTFVEMKLATSELDQLYDGLRHITLTLSEQVQVIGQLTDQISVTIANYTQFTTKYNDQSVTFDSYQAISILITINLTEAIESPTATVTLLAPENISNKQGQSLQVAYSNIKIKSYQIQSVDVQDATEGLMSFSQYILYVMLGLACIAFLFGGLNIFWNLLDLLQLLSYIKYFNVQYPYNVDFYFTLFGFAEFDFLKQYVNLEEFISQYLDTPDADPKFQEEGYSTLFLVNAIAVLTVFFTTLATYFMCQLFSFLLKKIAQSIIAYKIEDEEEAGISFYFLMKITKNLETYLFNITAEFNSGLLRTFMAVAFDLNLAIFLQLKDFNYRNVFLLFNGVVSIFAFAFELYYILFGFLIMSKPDYYLKLKSTEYMYGALYEGLKIKKNCFILAFNLLNLIKKMAFMFFLVFLYNVPSFQIAFASLLNLAFAIYILYTQPLDDSTEFHKNYICELILWTIELLALLFAFTQQSNTFDTEQELLIGWFIIGLCTLVIIIQLILDVKQHAEFLVSQYTILQKLVEKLRGIFNREAGQEEESFFLRKHMPGHKQKTKESKKIKKVVTFSVESSSYYS